MANFKLGDYVEVQPPPIVHPCYGRYRGLMGRIIYIEEVRDSFNQILVTQYTLEWIGKTPLYAEVCDWPKREPSNLIQEDWLVLADMDAYRQNLEAEHKQQVIEFMQGMKETLHG